MDGLAVLGAVREYRESTIFSLRNVKVCFLKYLVIHDTKYVVS